MSKKYKKNRYHTVASPAPIQKLAPYFIAILFFFAVCLCAVSTIKGTALVLVFASIAAVCLCFAKLRERLHIPFVALTAFVLMGFISTLYAVSGKFALNEFLKIIASFAIILLLLALTPGDGVTPGRRIAAVFAHSAALMGIVSIDLLSTRWISGIFTWVLQIFSSDYEALAGVESGVRMTSVFRNPNVFAGIAGIGVLLSLGLVLSSERGKERISHVVCLFVNALAFVLAFSMGATGVIAVAFLVYLILERKNRRAGLFILMLETLVITMVGVVVISMTAFQAWDGFQPIPMLSVIVGAAALGLLDHFVGQRAAETLGKHGKALLIIIIGLLVVLLVGIVAAYNLTDGADLGAGERLRRSAYPESGDYTVTAQATGPVFVKIESQNKRETMMHTSTILYKGDLSSASFTVPEDSLVVYFNLQSGQDVSLECVSFSGPNGEGEVPLGYKLLPGFIANRVQGLFANQNAIQRTVFFEDGLKIFKQSPIFGSGLGSFENRICSVQTFFYETKYAHNHYIQALVETGVIGLILFVGLLVSSAAVVLLARRKEKVHSLTPALGAALVFMAGHAAVEVVFSHFAYLPMAFGVFALINLCCGEAIAVPRLGKKAKNGILSGIAAILVIFFVLLCGNMRADGLVKKVPTFDSLDQAIKMDKYEWADYMLSYVLSAPNAPGNVHVQDQAAEYAAHLGNVDSNTLPVHLAKYYFDAGDVMQGMAMIEKYVTYVSSDPTAWQTAFDVMESYESDSEAFRAGVIKIAQLLESWNAENMGTITLSESNQAFLERMGK